MNDWDFRTCIEARWAYKSLLFHINVSLAKLKKVRRCSLSSLPGKVQNICPAFSFSFYQAKWCWLTIDSLANRFSWLESLSGRLYYTYSDLYGTFPVRCNFKQFSHYVMICWRFQCDIYYVEGCMRYVSLLPAGMGPWTMMFVFESYYKTEK